MSISMTVPYQYTFGIRQIKSYQKMCCFPYYCYQNLCYYYYYYRICLKERSLATFQREWAVFQRWPLFQMHKTTLELWALFLSESSGMGTLSRVGSLSRLGALSSVYGIIIDYPSTKEEMVASTL